MSSNYIITDYKNFVEKKQFKLLDGVRGLSIAAVIWHHSSGYNPSQSQFFLRGYLGVDMFFVLSGFLITFLLIKEQRKNNCISLQKFYIRRSLRIFPLYFSFLCFSTIWILINSPEMESQVKRVLPYYILYISNWIPVGVEQYFDRAWSLAVEEQFYLVWPVLFAVLPLFRSVSVIVFFIFAVTLIDLGAVGGYLSTIVKVLIPFRTLLLGCLLAVALCNYKSYMFLQAIFTPPLTIIFVAGLLLYSIARVEGPIEAFNLLAIHLLMVSFLACAVLNESNFLKLVLSWKPLQICGVVSYGIYILHSQFWGVTQKLVGFIPVDVIAESRITFSLVFIMISCSIALLSYHYFESWFLALKKKYGR